MKSKLILVASAAGMLLVTTFLIGASPASRAPAQWEYGVYTESTGNYEWQDANQQVRATTADFFFEKMGLPSGIEVDARTGRLSTLLLNHLGRQGWELVDVLAEEQRDVYWLKRPR